jgi:hypothetical protein
LWTAQPQVFEQRDKTHLRHRPQRHRLHPGAARAAQFQRVDVDRLHIAPVGAAGEGRGHALARQQPGEQSLRLPFDGPGAGQHGALAAA